MFMLFKKLLSALNSAQSSWQITLAILFAMFTGFAPLYVPFNLLFLFIVFTLNIPIGIYFALTAIFASIGYLIDSIFDGVGYALLTLPSLENFWGVLYSYPLTNWTNLNHSTTLGSLVVSFVLSLPLFFILNKLIDKYRDLLESKFKNSKWFGWLNPYSEKKLKKRAGLIRWWGSGLFLLISGLSALFVSLFLDPILKKTVEYTLAKLTNTTVHISKFESNFNDLTLNIDTLKFIPKNQESSTLVVDNINATLNYEHLIAKKLDFTQIYLNNIRPNHKVSISQEEKESAGFNDSDIKLPEIQMPEVDTLIKSENLESKKGLKSINEENDAITKRWTKFQKEGLITQQRKVISENIASIEKRVSAMKNQKDIEAIVKDVSSINNQIQSINSDIARYTKAYNEDMATIKANITKVTGLPVTDYNNLLNKYQLNSIGALNFVETYIGPSLSDYMRDGLKYYEIIKPYIQSDEDESDEGVIKREGGRRVVFAKSNPYPDFVIQKIGGNIITKSGQNYTLNIYNITDDQRTLNKLITVDLIGKDTFYEDFSVKVVHNNLTKDAQSDISFLLKGFTKSAYTFSKEFSLKNSEANGNGRVTINNFKSINGVYTFDIYKTDMQWANEDTSINKIVKDVLQGVKDFSIDGEIKGEILKPNISLTSNLDKKINSSIKKVFDKKVSAYKKELQTKLDNIVKTQLKQLNLSENQIAKVEKLLSGDSTTINNYKEKIANEYTTQALTKKLQDKINAKSAREKKILEEKAKAEEARLKAQADKKAKELEQQLKNRLNSIKF